MNKPPGIDVQPYLNSVVTAYEKWRQYYTLTDAEGKQRQQQESAPIFDFGLMVQTVPTQPQEQPGQKKEEVERFSVLDGLRKYALGDKPEPVLLMGRPGSGKSTALAKLLLEEATQTSEMFQKSEFFKNSDFSPSLRIPILVELRYWQGSIAQLILNALNRHDLAVTSDQLETVLKQSLLLFDGVNELPSEEARTQLSGFRRDHPKVPMIFTTRDLSLGGDLGIERKLEMQPLTEPQMQAFIQAYVPEQAEAMLKQLKDRLREFGKTPLLLWMLCSLFQQTQTIPQNLGEVFRAFTQGYERKLKQDVVVESDRRLWPELLKVLAAQMMQGEKPTEFRVAIAPSEIYHVFADYLQTPDPLSPRKALDDLLKHHLLQLNGELVEFRHQLLREYYAAEWLLERLAGLDDLTLQREYLNYLKWTEPLALMLALVTDEALAMRVVERSLSLDWGLGARLAGEVKPNVQDNTVSQIAAMNVPTWLRVELLGKTKSEVAIPGLLKALEDSDWNVRWSAADALGKLGLEAAIPGLLQALQVLADSDWDTDAAWEVRERAAEALENLGSEAAVPGLLKALEHSDSDVRRRAAEALGNLGSEAAVPGLLQALEHSAWDVRENAAKALGNLGSEAALPGLLQALEHSAWDVSENAAKALGNLGSKAAAPGLLQALKHSDSGVRRSAAEALGNLGSEAAVPGLLQALADADSGVQRSAAEALGKLGSAAALPGLFQALADADSGVRRSTVEALGKLGSAAALPGLFQALADADSGVCRSAVEVLGNLGSEAAVPGLLQALEHSAWDVRERAVDALGRLGSEAAVPGLLQALEDSTWNVRWRAAAALGELGSAAAVPGLLQALEGSNSDVRWRAAAALGRLGSAAAVPGLLQALEGSDSDVRKSAAEALGSLGSAAAVPGLLQALADSDSDVRRRTAEALGRLGSEAAVPGLLQALEDSDTSVRESAAAALGNLGSEAVLPGLLKALADSDSDVRRRTAEALGELGSEAAVPGLLQALEDSDTSVRESAAAALGKLGSEAAIPGLLKALADSDSDVRESAAAALGNFKDDRAAHVLPALLFLSLTQSGQEAFKAIQAIQANCKFYNYEIWQVHVAAQQGDNSAS